MFSKSQEQTEATFPQMVDANGGRTEDVEEISQTVKALLPPRKRKEGRKYIADTSKRRACYWVHFWEYVENDKRRAECMYCENKTYACDSNLNGSSKVRNHWLKCPANPLNKSSPVVKSRTVNKSKLKQTKLVFEMVSDGEGKLKNREVVG